MRKPIIAGNWKMNSILDEAVALVKAMLPELCRLDTVEIVLCPPFISLAETKKIINGTSIKLGAQNMYFKDKGAYTGEISPLMLAGLCDFVIVGHSERRWLFGETDDMINKKIKAAFEFGLKPILCVGESIVDNEANKTATIIVSQIRAAVSGIAATDQLVIAYEPIWAIGTGKAATGKQANATISLIRDTIAQLWGNSISQAVRILYGGSVTESNIAEFASEPDIDGALVGGASLKASDFVSIVRQTAGIKSAL